MAGTYRLSKSRTFQFFGHIINKGDTEEKHVALTFDDGPYPGTTDEVLSILTEKGVQATFFLNGAQMQAYPDETISIIEAGHELGNHSYNHKRLMLMPYSTIQEEMESTDEVMKDLGYEPTGYVRSPYCKKLFMFPLYLKNTNQYNVTWSIEPETYYSEGPSMVKHIEDALEPGAIILLHSLPSGRTETRAYLADMIDAVQAKGYQFVTVEDLLGEID